MNRSSYFFTGVLAMLLVLYLGGTAALAAEKSYTMVGKITAIELASNTVVVDVPLAHRIFTVAGPLSAHPVLRIGHKRAKLDDFKVGNRVTVHWKATVDGHLVTGLIEKG